MPDEPMRVFMEARMAFISGYFVSTLLLVCAFFEHKLGDVLRERGFVKESTPGLEAITGSLRAKGLCDAYLLDRVDRLRLHRNPFVHTKPLDHPHILIRRVLKSRQHPDKLLEADAREGLCLMYQIAMGKGIRRRELT